MKPTKQIRLLKPAHSEQHNPAGPATRIPFTDKPHRKISAVLNRLSIHLSTLGVLLLGVAVIASLVSVPATAQTTTVNICDRTPQVRDAILAAISNPPPACEAVPETDLAGISSLSLSGAGITALTSGDFTGLSALVTLNLSVNSFTTLPADIFDGLSALVTLNLLFTGLTTLPADVFDGLSALVTLGLTNTPLLTTLPDGVFDGLSALVALNLGSNGFTTLPDGVFDSLSALETLDLSANAFTTLPDGVFDDVLDTLGAAGLFVDDAVRNAHFVCSRADADAIVAATAGVTDCLRITSAQLAAALSNADLSALAISEGTLTPVFDPATFTYSAAVSNAVATLTITPTTAGSGATVAVTVNAAAAITTPPFTAALDVGANTIEVVVTAADSSTLTYILTVTRASGFGNVLPVVLNICDRTPQVQAAILAAISDPPPACESVLDIELAGISSLDLTSAGITSLASDDLIGLPALQTLDLRNNGLTTLPADVFDDLSTLETLDLRNNAFTTLPDGVFDDVLDTLGAIDVAFRVDDTVRSAHFVCSRADADAIVAATAGVTDCLRITSAQLAAALSNADLSALAISEGTLTPVFDPATSTYSAAVSNAVATLTITPTTAGSGATVAVTVNAAAAITTPPFTAALDVGANTIEVVVTAADSSTQTYSLAVTRAQARVNINICDRTPQVEAEILLRLAINPTPACESVPVTGLAGITFLIFQSDNITSLASGDFADLPALDTINLDGNRLTTLPADIFDGLSVLRLLTLRSNDLTTLPADVFDGLSALETLILSETDLTTLPADIFDGLSVLGSLSLGSNDLTTLPADVFDGLSALEELELDDNNFTALTGLPEGVFDDVLDTLGAIGEDESFRVDNNVRSAHFVCSRSDADAIVAATAGVDDCLRITSAQFNAVRPNTGLSALTISRGTLTPAFDRATFTYSATVPDTVATLTITPTVAGSGATVAVTVNAAAAMTTPPFTAALDVGANAIEVVVTAADSYTQTYRLTVTRDAPPTVNICDRTPQVEAAILAAINPTPACESVLESDLAGITALDLEFVGITSLASGDFTGLAALETLNLRLNNFTSLPAGVFDGLVALETLNLSSTGLTTLPADIFDGLSALESLNFQGAISLTTLPADVFDRLSALVTLNLSAIGFTTLPAGVFDRLAALERLDLRDNALTTLPDGVFDRLAALETLNLRDNDFTTLPAGVFNGLSALEELILSDNPLTTLPNGVFNGLSMLERLNLLNNAFTAVTGLPAGVFDDVLDTLGAIGASESFRVDDTVRDAHFVCSRADADDIVAATDGVTDCLRITTAQLVAALPNAGLSALTISQGTLTPAFDPATFTYSATVPNAVATLTITPTVAGSGATVAVTVNAAAAMTTPPFTAALDVGANAIEVVVTAADSYTQTYRLTVTRDAPPSVNICDRTPQVEAAILAAINPTPACESVPETDLAGITALDLDSAGITSLANGDFAGLSGLETLNLNFNSFTTLSAGVFDGLVALETLILTNSLLTTLPAGVFDGLEELEFLDLSRNLFFTTLPADVFAGLSALVTLDLSGTTLTTLPAGVFDDLSALESLDFGQSRLTTLPDGVFDRLSALERLDFNQTRLTTLPDGVFNRLSALEFLNLSQTRLNTLPAGVFDGLSALEDLRLNDSAFTTLPAGVFNGLAALERLNLFNNNFTTLPDGVFDDVLDTLGTIDVAFNVDDTVRNAHFVCSRPDAATIVANTDGVTDCLRVTTAQLVAALPNTGLSALTISRGTLTPVFDRAIFTYSATVPNTVATLTLTPTVADSGSTVAVTVNAAAAMTTGPFTAALDVGANAIEVVVTAADSSTQTYSLAVTRDEARVNICDRTPQVEAAILAGINPAPACESVPESELADINFLNLESASITSLASGDFTGLSALETLILSFNNVTTLPADVFDGLSALEMLDLGGNGLTTTLPADVFDGLSALERLDLSGNALTTLPADIFDGLSALERLDLSRNNFTALTGLPAGVFDDVLDTLGAIGGAFRVDDNVRSAHFVCSRADADAIVAATAGVDDCLRITSAQLPLDVVQITLDADIAGDDVVNIVERRDGFTIGGTVAATAAVSVTVGGGSARDATVSDTTWSLAIAANDADITGAEVEIVVTATLSGNQDGEARRTLTVDLTAPAATWTLPATLTVGTAITDIPAAGPSADIPDANGYAATDLPAGLMINADTGAISGAPTTANANPAMATITLTDTNGNTGAIDLTFPAVDRSSQTLTGFAYSATTAMVGDTAPTVTAPTGAVAGSTLSYSTNDTTICTVDAGTGVLTLVGAGTCTITVTASATANHNAATADFEIQVGAAGMVMVTLDADIAGDDVVNIVERRDGFTIGGTVAAAAAVSVTVGGGSARDATVSDTVWSLAIAANDADITGAEVEIVVTATLSGNQDGEARRTLTVDLTAPTATWTAPATLTVGVAIADIPAAGPSADIPDANGYAATDLPAGLMINANTGAISGAPTTANANVAVVTITLTDTNGNTGAIDLTFPAVDRGSQTLTGFAYSATTAMVGDTAPTVTAPTGAVAGSTLSYSTNDATICTVDAGTGVLTLVGAGTCTITVTASATANHNAATADFEIQVGAAGMVMVTLDADIAGDDVVNIVEQRDGFTIGGTVAATAAVSVTVGGGSARDATVSDTTWSLAIAANDADITGAEVEIVVTATLSGNQDGEARRTLMVDLTAPTATWTAPATLTVGTAITDIPAAGPSADIPGANGYAATDLPAGLMINANTGAISGAPTTANPDPATATITLTDTNGNTGTVDLTFPAVDRGSQILTGFIYSATTATVDQTAPTVTAPTGAVAGSTLSYSTSDATICTVDAGTGVLTAVGAGTCTITVAASATANHNAATADFEIQVGAAGMVMVTLDADIAGDDVVNIVERRDGFTIGGTVAATAAVSVTVGGGGARDATVSGTVWSLAIAANDADITGAEVEIVVTATLSGNQDGAARRTLTVDLTAPAATWTAPATLTVGVAITDIPAAGPSADIPDANGYAATDLPAGLMIDANTGAISGAPTTANPDPATATITLTDTNGNTGTIDLTFPAVDRGTQILTGFAYSATTAMVGDTAPTVTAPTGAVAGSTLSYSTSDATICTVDAGTGVLTAVGAGTCTITVTASATANHNAATADFEIQVGAADTVMVTLDADIAGDDVVNIVERRDGFTIGGTVAATAAVSVTVGGGSARDATVSDTTWSLAIAANDADITGAEVEIVVTATLSGNQDGEARRTLTVDLTAPAATWTAPATLTVGVAIADIPAAGPSADIPDANGYAATDLPAGLMINANTGAISGAPTTANANVAVVTITLTDTNGNTGEIDLTFPAVDRGSQTLTGFAYSATTAMVGDTAPTVTAPTGAVASSTLSYSTNDPAVCTVDAAGALTLVDTGACTITATAAATDNYNVATASFTITVNAAGASSLTGATFDVAEDTADGANVGNPLTAANFPSGDQVWSITGSTPGSAPFAIDATSGQLSVDGALDFEATASYTLTIQLAQGGQMATADVIISVTDVNQAPQAVATISAQTLVVSGAAVTLDVAANFNDPDGDTLTYTAQSGDTDIATVSAAGSMVTITPVAQGSAMVTVTATDTGSLTVTQSIAVTVNSAEVVSVTLDANIAGDDVVNIVEQRDGFTIGGAADAGATVMVTVGGMGITGSATATADNTWTLAVAGGFSGIAEPEVEVVATASMVTLTNGVVRRRLTVDLTAPTAIWTAPATLTAGEAIIDIIPASPSADIPGVGGYAASDLPDGLTIDADTGIISGAPTRPDDTDETAIITLIDTNGNTGAVALTFPAVGVGGVTITTTGNGDREISGDDNSIQVEVANDVPENVSLVIPDLSVVERPSTIEIRVGDLPPAPAGITFGAATTSVDINVSLTASAQNAQNALATVCLPRPAGPTESLAVYHYEQGQWEALPGVMAPSDLNDVVCGETNTFSPFQVGGLAAPRVTLVLDQTSIDEDGGVATLTARLNRALSVDTTLTVTVDPIGDTRARDFMLSGNVLTIVSGASTGSVTISAVDNGVGNPNRQVRISVTATTGDVSVTGPGSMTLTIIDDESAAQERREQGIAHALGGIARTLGWELTETIRERSRGADGVGSRVKVAKLPQSSTQGDDATMTDLLTSGTEIEMTSAPIDRATAPMVRAWAKGDKADFNNTPFDGRTQDGEIVSVRAGMDAAYDSGWVLGGAVGWHDIDVTFDDSVAATSGTIGGEIWSLNPYISLTRDRLHLWGAIGGGAGTLHYEDTQGATSSNLRMLNGAVGAEHGFGNIGAFDLIGRGEGMFVEIDLDGSPDARVGYDDQEVTVYGIRGEFELGLPLRRGGVDIRPYGLVGVRWDGGDMDTGAAAEYGVGIDLRSKDFYVEASARSQFSEEDDEGLNLTSYSLSFGYDRGNDQRGFMVEFGQSAGSSEYNPYGGGALPSFGVSAAGTDAEATIKLNARYGTEFGHGMLIPYVETDWRGSQLSTFGSGLKYEFKAADIGLHYDYAPTSEEDRHRINLRAQFRF